MTTHDQSSRLGGRPHPRPARRGAVLCAACLALALAACSATEVRHRVDLDPQTEVRVYDPAGQETDGRALVEQVGGLPATPVPELDWRALEASLDHSEDGGPRPSEQDPQPQDPAQQDPTKPPQAQVDQDEERRRAGARLRLAFGDTILLNEDGTVTKQYFLSQSAGNLFVSLLQKLGEPVPKDPPTGVQQHGGEQTDSVLGRMLGKQHAIDVVYIANFEVIDDTNLRPSAVVRAPIQKAATSNSLVLITAKAEALAAFEKALDLFYANIPQVQIEVKVVEYTTSDSLAIGVVPIDGNTPTVQNLGSGRLVRNIISDFTAQGFASGGNSNAGGIISLGGIHQSLELNAALQLLESQNIADVKSQPRMVVRNGGTATVATRTSQPFPVAKIINQTVTSTDIQFKDVGIVMDIRPEIAGTETVQLNIYISVSAITGFVASEPIPTPVISTREAATAVHLREGQTTVIGGLVSESNFDTERKIPILGDIPLLGMLFRSTLRQREKTTLEFHITPRILSGTRRTTGGL